jgi:hypothetical protein
LSELILAVPVRRRIKRRCAVSQICTPREIKF